MLFNANDLAQLGADEESNDSVTSLIGSLSFSGGEADIRKQQAKQLIEKLPTHEGLLPFTSVGRFSLHELLLAFVEKDGASDVIASTYSISEQPVRAIRDYFESGLINSFALLIDARFPIRKPKVAQFIAEFATLGYANCHAKILVMKSKTRSVTYVGSHNLTAAHRLESGCLFVGTAIADFYGEQLLTKINENLYT